MRKIFLGIVAAFIALFGLFGVQVHLAANVNEVGVVAGLLIVGAYLFMEFRQDWLDFKNNVVQTNKWSDPTFWGTLITSVLIPLITTFVPTLVIPDMYIGLFATLLSLIMPLFIKPASPLSTRKLIKVSQT